MMPNYQLLSKAAVRKAYDEIQNARAGIVQGGEYAETFFKLLDLAGEKELMYLTKIYPDYVFALLIDRHGIQEIIEGNIDIGSKYGLGLRHSHSGFRFFNPPLEYGITIEKLGRVLREMEKEKSETGILNYLVAAAYGTQAPRILGEMLEIESLAERDDSTDGYWDWINYQIFPDLTQDLQVIYRDEFMDTVYGKDVMLHLDYEEHSGDISILVSVPEGHWDKNS
jgi:hypothetical protein